MKKQCLLISIFTILTAVNLFSQNWIIYNTGAVHLNSMDFIDVNNGVAVGDSGLIMKTTNGGVNWNTLSSIIYSNIDNFKMLTADIWVSFDGEYITRTTNGGISWYYAYRKQNGSGVLLSFPNADTGYAAFTVWSSGFMVKTTDKGLTWGQPYENFYYDLGSLCFINGKTGFVGSKEIAPPPFAAYFLSLRRSTNGGANWPTYFNQSSSTYENTGYLYFKDENYGLWSTHDSRGFAKTVNGGLSWVNTGIPIECYSVVFVNNETGWLAGDVGQLYRSSDGGATWLQQNIGLTTTLKKIVFVNPNTGWVCEENGKILKTTNGGGYPIGVIPMESTVPAEYCLDQNYPNPFNPETNITFSIPDRSFIRIAIYDITGKVSAVIVNEELKPGKYKAVWNAQNAASGIYFYTLSSGGKSFTKKMLLLK